MHFTFFYVLFLLESVISIRIATYNIWNIMFNWEVRKLRISQLIKEADPDIIGFQEVRSDGSNTHNQIMEIQELLPQYSWHVYHPVQYVSFMKGTYQKYWRWEGIGFLSRYPLISSHVQNLTSNVAPDTNHRVVLHASFLINEQQVDTALVHFSYAKPQQCHNALQVVKFFKNERKNKNVILLGDFNAYNDYEDPVRTLTNQSSKCLLKPDGLPLKDAWPSVHPDDKGYTFSNMPSPGLESRPDRILVPAAWRVRGAELLGEGGATYRRRYGYHVLWHRAGRVVGTAREAPRIEAEIRARRNDVEGWRRGVDGREARETLEEVRSKEGEMDVRKNVKGRKKDAEVQKNDAKVQSHNAEVQKIDAEVQRNIDAKVQSPNAEVQKNDAKVRKNNAEVQSPNAHVQKTDAEVPYLRSCQHDCGPHASCRCGICVAGSDANACGLLQCQECGRSLLILLLLAAAFYLTLGGILIYAVLRVMHAMNQRGRRESTEWCCLLNPLLYTQFGSARRNRCGLSRLPPMLMVILCVFSLFLVTQLFLHGFKDILDDIFAIIPEEYFPSDHRLLVVEVEMN